MKKTTKTGIVYEDNRVLKDIITKQETTTVDKYAKYKVEPLDFKVSKSSAKVETKNKYAKAEESGFVGFVALTLMFVYMYPIKAAAIMSTFTPFVLSLFTLPNIIILIGFCLGVNLILDMN